MFGFICMLWFVIVVLRYVVNTIYYHMVTTEPNK